MAYTTINKHTDHFNTKLYTGNGSTQSITGVGFQPDWTWIKSRGDTSNHRIYDGVRGATKVIYSNLTNVEGTDTNGLTSFDSDGFSLGTEGQSNGNGVNFASWNWKAGTTGSGTTGGSGTAKDYEYSVNTTAGFSIIKYKGNGTAGHTIPHHLGAVPKMIIVKCIESTHNWQVLHQGLATNSGTKNLELNSTSAVLTDSTTWNNTAPTSTVFTLGSTNPTNQSSSNFNFVAYCFAEKTGYSKFGKYTGNGNADGPFIYTGFKPEFVIIKQTNAVDDWVSYDWKSNEYNQMEKTLRPHSNAAEINTNRSADFYSNGFKWRSSNGTMNESGASYIYMAFGQSLVGSNNVPCTAR
jgi:hypothetical protein